ncbi:MAG: winged helix-turn-helix transcriptional regulator [Alphaproteobacteria bacterium]|nr:winged helix-turn-helix transcriptional regulator [Alphaproteobacteria bacterium]
MESGSLKAAGSALASTEPALPEPAEAPAITLGVLDAVESDSRLSQRSLASELGIALGLTNAYLKRCVRKGWVKVRHVPANRYLYYLTPKGFSEKSRLTAQYLARSFRFYRSAREEVSALIGRQLALGRRRILLAGTGDLAEVALICALEHEVEIVGVLDPGSNAARFMRAPRFARLEDAPAFDAVVMTDVRRPQHFYDDHLAALDPETVVVPSLLKVTRRAVAAEAAS